MASKCVSHIDHWSRRRPLAAQPARVTEMPTEMTPVEGAVPTRALSVGTILKPYLIRKATQFVAVLKICFQVVVF